MSQIVATDVYALFKKSIKKNLQHNVQNLELMQVMSPDDQMLNQFARNQKMHIYRLYTLGLLCLWQCFYKIGLVFSCPQQLNR